MSFDINSNNFFPQNLFNLTQRVSRIPCQLQSFPVSNEPVTMADDSTSLLFHSVCLSSLWILRIPQKLLLAGAGSQVCLVSACTLNVIVFFMVKYKLWPGKTRSERNYRSCNQWMSFIDNKALMMIDVAVSTPLYCFLIQKHRET